MHADHALGLVARPDLALDKQFQHRGDRAVFGLGDLLEARVRLGVEADSHARTGGGVGVRHAPYLHQSDAPFKGGVVPREYIPAVEKGVVEALNQGVLAGYPVVDVKVTLTFGSYHDVDSNENAFKMAAIFGFKEGCRKANPVILEPMMAVEVETPEDYAGNVMGDLSSRRGMVQGMDDMVGGGKAIKAEVPLSEMFGYSTTLRSMSQGRATYTMEFKHYAEAPRNVAEAIVAARAK